MPTQHIVKNRILRQLSADELKSVQPWLTLQELRSNVVLHERGDSVERVYFPLSPFTPDSGQSATSPGTSG